MARKKPTPPSNTIAANKKASFEYHLEERFEAGLVLHGWEVKSLRAGKAQLTDSYVIFKDGEAWLLGARITPLATASTHVEPDPARTRKLLLKRRELDKLMGAVHTKGYTCVCPKLYWKHHIVKVEIALAKGKQKYDKRETERNRDWDRQKQRILREANK